MAYIEIDHVTKTIKGVDVLDDVCLSLDKNQIYGFVGINGSGKTMLLRAIAGLITPTRGTVTVNHLVVGNGVHPNSIGLLIENADFWPELSAMEVLKVLNNISKRRISQAEIEELLASFGLDPTDRKAYKRFSLGMKQKLRLAQAFMGEPELLLLDEPTNALDENSIAKLRKQIMVQKEKGATVLLASHARTEVEILCDEIVFLKRGRITHLEKVE